MPDFHKTLILADIHTLDDGTYTVEELAMTTEHAPFRHKKITLENHVVGAQVKNNNNYNVNNNKKLKVDTNDTEKEEKQQQQPEE
jgi:hypothetical protein